MTRKIEQVRFAESAPKKKRVAAYAQEESLSVSENMKWRIRRNFEDGKPWSGFVLGYRCENGQYVIVPEEAEVVRCIYREYLEGLGAIAIMKGLNDDGIRTRTGKPWRMGGVLKVLKNYNYTGNLLLQKTYSENHLTKKMKVNEGEVPQYYVENSHPAIIDAKAWDMVQGELRRRKESSRRTTSQSPFSGRIFCGDCGEQFGPKVWHSNSQYRRVIWQCNHKFKGAEKCTTPHLTEDALKEYTRQALNFLIENRKALIEDGRLVKQALSDHTEIDAELRAIAEEMEVVAGLIEKSIATNAITALDQDEYAKTYESLTERYTALQKRYTALTRQREDKQFKADELSGFLFELGELDLLDTEWKDSRFRATAERITVHNDGRLVFTFTNGSEETVMM